MKTMNYRGIIQGIKYLLLAVLFFILMFAFAHMGWGTNTQGCNCDPYLWEGTKNIGSVTTNMYFQAMWDDMPCRWTGGYYFGFYMWTILLYSMFKHFGNEILGRPVSLKINVTEFIIAWAIYFVGLLNKVAEQNIPITFNVAYNAFIGTFLLLLPILCLIFLILLYNKLDTPSLK